MSLDQIVAIVDTAILGLLVVWAFMDRCNFYFRK